MWITELLDVFRKASEIDDKRIIQIKTDRGTYIYDDGKHNYAPLFPEFSRSISNVESLAMAVVEECKRRDNPTGNFMTVMFNEKGGIFYPDDKKRLDKWSYDRALSQQWEFLSNNINRDLDHLSFIRILQGLRPSFNNYTEIMREYKKVTFDGKTSVTSQPMIEQGIAGAQVNFTLETKSGHNTETIMPGEFELIMPFTRGGSKVYTFTIYLDVALDTNNGVKFRLVFPDKEIITEQAIEDEIEFFKTQVGNQSDLLVLLDY